jgi:hypothetical protein
MAIATRISVPPVTLVEQSLASRQAEPFEFRANRVQQVPVDSGEQWQFG